MPATFIAVLPFGAATMLGLAAQAGQDGPPPVFDQRPYAAARKAAQAGKKWFVVQATATWCLPCKQMDKTTWRDEAVVLWLRANAMTRGWRTRRRSRIVIPGATTRKPREKSLLFGCRTALIT